MKYTFKYTAEEDKKKMKEELVSLLSNNDTILYKMNNFFAEANGNRERIYPNEREYVNEVFGNLRIGEFLFKVLNADNTHYSTKEKWISIFFVHCDEEPIDNDPANVFTPRLISFDSVKEYVGNRHINYLADEIMNNCKDFRIKELHNIFEKYTEEDPW